MSRAKCARRSDQRKWDRLQADPMVQRITTEVSTMAFAAFVRNAFQNRPKDIDEKTWGMTVELVMKAGRGQETQPAFEVRDLPEKGAETEEPNG